MAHASKTEQFKYWVLAWVSLAEDLVVILSLGVLCPHWRGDLLFSKWMDS